jgi:hypothetical protein
MAKEAVFGVLVLGKKINGNLNDLLFAKLNIIGQKTMFP